MLFILNMYPVLPLDGGRMVYAISEKASEIISILFLIVLSVISVYLVAEYKIFSLLFIALYLIVFNLKQMRFI